jgi:hypothetical protein
MDIRLIFRNRPRIVCTARCRLEEANRGWPTQVGRACKWIPGGSKGVTQSGSSSVLWLCTSKQVGGVDRQIRPLIQPRDANERGVCLDSSEPSWQEKRLARSEATVPQSDTGRRVENTKAIGRTLVKELGNMAP